jgi:chromosome partitioning protein
MVTLTVVGPRAGTGKTTTAINLAAELAAAGRHVALLDLDPNAGATRALGHLPESDPWQAEPVEIRLDAAARGVLRLARGGRALVGARGHDVRVLMGALSDRSDMLVVDLPPGATALTTAAVEAADVLLTPVPADGGVADVRAAAQLRTVLGGAGTDLRIVLVRQPAVAPSSLRALFDEAYPRALCGDDVPEDLAAANAARLGVPLRVHAPESDAGRAYRSLARELSAYHRAAEGFAAA